MVTVNVLGPGPAFGVLSTPFSGLGPASSSSKLEEGSVVAVPVPVPALAASGAVSLTRVAVAAMGFPA